MSYARELQSRLAVLSLTEESISQSSAEFGMIEGTIVPQHCVPGAINTEFLLQALSARDAGGVPLLQSLIELQIILCGDVICIEPGCLCKVTPCLGNLFGTLLRHAPRVQSPGIKL